MKLIVSIYGFFCFLFILFSYLFIDPNFPYLHSLYSGIAYDYRLPVTIAYIFFIIIFFSFYVFFLRLVKRGTMDGKLFRRIIILQSILLFAYPALLSYDIFNYIATSKVLYFYKENPYIIMPIEFPGDPVLLFTHAANKLALYGPSWIVLSSIPYILGFKNFLLTIIMFKFFVGLFYAGSIWLLWKISRNLLTVSLFALNPLVVIETLISGHNDSVMVFFVLLSFFLVMRKRYILSFLCLILSVLIKYATIFLLPVYLFILYKKVTGKNVQIETVFLWSGFLMFFAFLLSPVREEIYPWYAIWFLPFIFVLIKRRFLLLLALSFSFGLLFRYVPFMLLGTYFFPTPLIKELVTFVPPLGALAVYLFRKEL